MEKRILEIERKLQRQKMYTYFVIIICGAFLFFSFSQKDQQEVIKTRGIIIVDAEGNERILIGSPIPMTKNRVRTNLEKVKEMWGSNFPPQYMEWYKNYRHEVNGILFLDNQGFDRLAIGENLPDPNIGKRIGTATGMIINDEKGFERSGYSLIDIKGEKRMVLGLDRPGGTEGVLLSILEDGTAGLDVNNKDNSLFLGSAPEMKLDKVKTDKFCGLKVTNPSGTTYELNKAK
jgi:hypothetical protein